MNAPSNLHPCEAFEHEIADLVDGLLSEAQTGRVRSHLAACGACRSWQAEYAAVHARLAGVFPKPSLSAGFDAALHARIEGLKAANGRESRRMAADQEHDALLVSLRRQTGRRAVLGALGAASVVALGLFAVEQLVLRDAAVHAALQGGERLTVACGAIGAAIAATVIVWTLSRSAMVTPRFLRW
jgi:anti-sigma factor RsiW